jgi:hypothetical protein
MVIPIFNVSAHECLYTFIGRRNMCHYFALVRAVSQSLLIPPPAPRGGGVSGYCTIPYDSAVCTKYGYARHRTITQTDGLFDRARTV